jgi:1,4-alpha-glucan branching enzyme
MKYFLISLSILFGFIATSFAQVIRTEPVFPKQTDTVSIFFNAKLGNAALAGASQVYAHAGVITSLSTSIADWKYVVGTWGTADSRVKMTALGNDLWQIKYHIQSFYAQAGALKTGESIVKMAFVFRDEKGNLVGRTASGGDIYTDVYSQNSDLLVKILTPEAESSLGESNTIFKLTAAASKISDWSVFVNGTLQRDVQNKDTLQSTFANLPVGNNEVVVQVINASDTARDTVNFVINPKVVNESIPSGIEQGLTRMNDSSIYLALYAPYKKNVYVLGDFSNWNPDVRYFMKFDASKSVYWIKIEGLKPNTEIGYQYLVDGSIKIADPFSEIMLNEWDDAYIPTSNYPNLKTYPKNKTTGWVSVFNTTKSKYNWKASSFKRPSKDKLVIYELLVRDFTKAQSFKSIIDTLDYLQRLGINAIEFMPLTEFEGNISWGYNPASHMALDKYYGNIEILKELVDSCHARGIAVILDVVFNHAFSTASICQLYWDANLFRPTNNNPYVNPVAKHPFNVGYDLNHESSATKYYVKHILEYLTKEFHFDGYRFDLSKGFTQKNSGEDVGLWGNYDASRIEILDGYHKHLQSIDSGLYTILEHFADNTEEIELAKRGMMLWGNATHNTAEAAMGFNANSDFGWGLDYSKRGISANSIVSYASSHDEERMGYKCKNFGNAFGVYNTKSLNTYLKRNALVYAFSYLTPGPKMIWQFDELGYDYSINYCQDGSIKDQCRVDPKPVKWDYWTNISDRPDLYYQHAMFLNLKTKFDDVSLPKSYSLNSSGSFKRLELKGNTFSTIVIGNFDLVTATKKPNFDRLGMWYEYLTGDSLLVNDVNMDLVLSAGDYRIYTSQKIDNPFLNIGNVSRKNIPQNNAMKVYPNPSNGETFQIQWSENAEYGRLRIYETTGRTVYSGDIKSGETVFTELSAGVYFISVESQEKRYLSKIWVD